jgi:hypothetical protein
MNRGFPRKESIFHASNFGWHSLGHRKTIGGLEPAQPVMGHQRSQTDGVSAANPPEDPGPDFEPI